MQSLWFYLSALLMAATISVFFIAVAPYAHKTIIVLKCSLNQSDANYIYRLKLYLGKRLWQYTPWTVRQHLRRIIVEDQEQFLVVTHSMLGAQTLIVLMVILSFMILRWLLGIELSLIWCIALMLLACVSPYLQYKQQQRKRQFQLRTQLPFFMDVFVLSIEAGAGLVLALQSSAESLPEGLLKRLIEQTIFDMQSGLSREASFKKLANDSGIVELESFASGIVNAVQMGLSLAPILRAQSDQYRQERFLRAEKAALEAPVKMLFPIVSCIFPCTFLVIAYPIVYGLLSSLS